MSDDNVTGGGCHGGCWDELQVVQAGRNAEILAYGQSLVAADVASRIDGEAPVSPVEAPEVPEAVQVPEVLSPDAEEVLAVATADESLHEDPDNVVPVEDLIILDSVEILAAEEPKDETPAEENVAPAEDESVTVPEDAAAAPAPKAKSTKAKAATK